MQLVQPRRGVSMFVVMFAILAVAVGATWLIPAGRFDTVAYDKDSAALIVQTAEGAQSMPATQAALDQLGVRTSLEALTRGAITKPLVIPGSYQNVEASPQPVWSLLTAPPAGVADAVDVILFVLVIGGFVGVLEKSGAMGAGVAALTRRFKGREAILVIALTVLFGLGGTLTGMAEETVAFYPILVPAFLAAGYDRIVPLAVVLGGSQVGCMAATVNPFSIIIASEIVGVAWTEQLALRAAFFVLAIAALVFWTLRYGARVRRDPTRSFVAAGGDPAMTAAENSFGALDLRRGLQLALFLGAYVGLTVGVSFLGWWFREFSALFLGCAIAAGLLLRDEGRIDAFIDGARALLAPALIIGLARAITIVLSEGRIEASLVNAAGTLLHSCPPALFLIAGFFLFAIWGLIVSSSSATAVLTMPLLGPIASLVGLPAATLVSLYVMGHNLTSTITPMGLLPALAITGVGVTPWMRFILPLMGVLATGALALLLATLWF